MKRALFIICLGIVMAASVMSQSTQQNLEATTSKASAGGLPDPKEIEAFFDSFFTQHVARSEFPSAAVVLVKDDHVFFEKGYGYTNFEKTKLVSANKTVFYAASVSKLFVATAIMQLAEQGRLNVNDDVNKYLKGFQLENKFGQPVTIANLLTHTGGLDEHLLGTEIPISAPPLPMADYFAKYTPRRILSPGDQINYSNHGMALAGYIVESVSGMPFYEYAERNIFAPLEMRHSSFRQPVPPDLAADMGLRRFDPAYLIPYPAGTLVTSAEDMGRFMMAHLNGGKGSGGRILREETIVEMHRQHFTSHPQMPGVAYSFFESFANHRRGLFHTGARDHQSLLYLLPEENLGIYVVLSGTDAEGALCGEVLQAFLDRYYPDTNKNILPNKFSVTASPDVGQQADRFTGIYRVNLVSRTTIERLAALGMEGRVLETDDGELTLALPGLERPGRTNTLIQVEPLFFRTTDGGFVAFREEANGRMMNMFMSGGTSDPMSFEKISWYESGRFHIGLIIAGFTVFSLFLLVSFVSGLVALWQRRKSFRRSATGAKQSAKQNSPKAARLGWRVATLVSLLVILSPVSAVVMVFLTKEHQLYNIPPILYVALGFLLAASAISLTLPFFAVLAWQRRYWSLGGRVIFSLTALASLLMMPMMKYWNLLGFHF